MKYLILTILILTSCAHDSDKKEWEPVIDQIIRGKGKMITFARVHYPLARTAAMNRMRNGKTRKLMRKTCEPHKLRITNDKFTETDFITLRDDYHRNIQIRVYEFICVKK